MNALPANPNITLSQYTDELTLQLIEGQPSINPEDAVNVHRVLQVLHRRMKNHPILIGEESTRKTAIIYEATRRILKADLPEGIVIPIERIVVFRHEAFFAGTDDFPLLRSRLDELVEALKASQGKTALFVNDLHLLVGAMSERTRFVGYPLTIAQARGEIRLIGATTWENYHKYIDTSGFITFERKSQPILIESIMSEG